MTRRACFLLLRWLVPSVARAATIADLVVDAEFNSVSISPGDPGNPPPSLPTIGSIIRDSPRRG